MCSDCQRGKHARPQHRGLTPGQHSELSEQNPDGAEPDPWPQPDQQRCEQQQNERHVRTGHGQQVGERRRPEVVHDFGKLSSIVAVDEAGKQRCIPLR